MAEKHSVIIVGAGPAGIFAALRLSEKPGRRILLVDAGLDIERRSCPSRQRNQSCVSVTPPAHPPAGPCAFSDGKLTLSPEVWRPVGDIIGQALAAEVIDTVDGSSASSGTPAPCTAKSPS